MPAPCVFGCLAFRVFAIFAILQYCNVSPTLREFFPQTPTYAGHPLALLRRIDFHKFRLTGSSPLHKVAQTTKRTVSPTNFFVRTQPHWRTCLWGRLGTVNQRPHFKGLRTQPNIAKWISGFILEECSLWLEIRACVRASVRTYVRLSTFSEFLLLSCAKALQCP